MKKDRYGDLDLEVSLRFVIKTMGIDKATWKHTHITIRAQLTPEQFDTDCAYCQKSDKGKVCMGYNRERASLLRKDMNHVLKN